MTAKDVFEQVDLTERPHGGEWSFDARWEFYSRPCGFSDCEGHGMALLESIAESLTYDGTDGP